jgi:hypothetical protein
VNYLLYEIAQARVAELHREGELQRRAALAPPAKRTATRRRWPNSLRGAPRHAEFDATRRRSAGLQAEQSGRFEPWDASHDALTVVGTITPAR